MTLTTPPIMNDAINNTHTNYASIIKQIESLPVMPKEPAQLDKMRKALHHLGIAFDPAHTILIAGTNGKGTVSATLEALLLEAGETVGLYTSPHLIETTERFRLNGVDISQELFCETYLRIKPYTIAHNLTHFETLTLLAATLFFLPEKPTMGTSLGKKVLQNLSTQKKAGLPFLGKGKGHGWPLKFWEPFFPREVPKWKIFEVGLGGTWDATNAIPHHYNIITSLGFDHMNLLGTTLAEIAANKFGIIQPNSVVIHSPLPTEVEPLAQHIQYQTQSQWIPSVPFSLHVHETSPPEFFLYTHWETLWEKAQMKLPGLRAAQNSATALTAFEKLGFNPTAYLPALMKVRWPGRMERVNVRNSHCPVYFSGDHNPQGIESLIELLPHYPRKNLLILIGIVNDKELDSILSPLTTLENSSLFLTETPFRTRPLAEYGKKWLNHAKGAWKNPEHALSEVMKLAGPEDMIIVTGSLYLVGYLMRQLKVGTQLS